MEEKQKKQEEEILIFQGQKDAINNMKNVFNRLYQNAIKRKKEEAERQNFKTIKKKKIYKKPSKISLNQNKEQSVINNSIMKDDEYYTFNPMDNDHEIDEEKKRAEYSKR